MNIDNRTESYDAFIEKTKKQAKKLLKISKQNNSEIKIVNLSHAQELLAQINGFPDWHALETRFKKSTIIIDDITDSEKINNIDIEQYIINGTNILSTWGNNIFSFNINKKYKYTCFYDIPRIKYDENTIEKLEYIYSSLSSFNPIENNFQLLFLNSETKNIVDSNLISDYSKRFNLSERDFRSLFSISQSNSVTTNKFETNIVLSISSNNLEYIKHINTFLLENNFSHKNFITKDISLLYKNELPEKYIENKINLDIFSFNKNNIFNYLNKTKKTDIKKVLYALAISYNHNYDWFCSFDFSSTDLMFYFAESSEVYFNGIKSIINTGEYNNYSLNFDFSNKDLKLKEDFGLPLLDIESEQTIKYNNSENHRYSHSNIFVAGMSGSGKTTLINSLDLEYLFNFNTDLPHYGRISLNGNDKFLQFVKSCLNPKYHEEIGFYNISEKTIINPFDLNLGFTRLTEDQKFSVITILMLYICPENKFLDDENQLHTIFSTLIDIAFEKTSRNKNPKLMSLDLFDHGLLKEYNLLQLLNKHNIKANISFFSAADQLFNLGYIEEAQILYLYASPILSDVINSISDFHELDKKWKDYIVFSFKNLISDESPYNKTTNINIFNKKVIELNLSNSFNEYRVNHYLEYNKVISVKYLLCLNKLNNHFSYIKKDISYSILDAYSSYYIKKDKTYKTRFSFDEFNFNFYSISSQFINYFICFMRNFRKYNFESIFGSQKINSLDGLPFQILFSEFFILSYFSEDEFSKTNLKDIFGDNLDVNKNKIKSISNKNLGSFLYASLPVNSSKKIKNLSLKLNGFLLKNIQ